MFDISVAFMFDIFTSLFQANSFAYKSLLKHQIGFADRTFVHILLFAY